MEMLYGRQQQPAHRAVMLLANTLEPSARPRMFGMTDGCLDFVRPQPGATAAQMRAQ